MIERLTPDQWLRRRRGDLLTIGQRRGLTLQQLIATEREAHHLAQLAAQLAHTNSNPKGS